MPGLIHAVWARVSAAKLYRPADGKALMSFVVSGYSSQGYPATAQRCESLEKAKCLYFSHLGLKPSRSGTQAWGRQTQTGLTGEKQAGGEEAELALWD